MSNAAAATWDQPQATGQEEEGQGQGIDIIGAGLAIGAGFDVFTPLGHLAQEILANGYSLLVDIAGYAGRPIDVCWHLNDKGVRCSWPMVIDDCLCFVVDQSKVRYACALLRKVGMPALNPP